jgi:riboflavin synthase
VLSLGDASGVRIEVQASDLDLSDVGLGDSIAINGACMTVVAFAADSFDVEVSRESLARTVGLDALGPVNLEKALRLSDRIGGHLVTGHVDGIGQVQRVEPVGESWQLVVRVPTELGKFFARKGSITIDGVSLTVNLVTDHADGTDVEVNLIPHTWQVTTLHRLQAGSQVNLEIDLIARYLERMASAPARLQD